MDALERSVMIGHIARRVQEAGGRAMLVGGCVRDALLGRESGDIDCEVYGIAPDVLRAIAGEFGQVDESGARYGVYSLRAQGIDLAVPRLERRTGPLHGDFEVTPDPSLPVERAAMRRDFTVNAILRDALTGEYVDPFGGREDLAKGILRAVPGGQFEEDPLRVLRGAQFAARFHLRPDEDTIKKMAAMPLDRLSAPRVLQETKKALLHAGEPDVFFEYAKSAEEKGFKVIIAGAGMAAHLPGMCAAIFPMPVIGVPMSGKNLEGQDALYSIVQMPPGIPVATVAIDGGMNAAILAARILAVSDAALLERLKEYTKEMKETVQAKDAKLKELGYKEYLNQK